MDDTDQPRGPRGKRGLPFPYDQDLSGVLRNLNRRTAWGRDRLANDRVTAAFLAAGMRLLQWHLCPGGRQQTSSERLLLGSLSQRRVAAEFGRNPGPFVRHGNGLSMLRDRWSSHSDFITDLLGFAVWSENYRPEHRSRRAAHLQLLVHGRDFARAVHEIAYQHTAEGVDLPSVRLSLALMTAAEGNAELARIISRLYEDYLGSWKELYAAVLRERRLRLRAGLTLDDLADALSAATDGIILRAIGDPGAAVLDHTGRRSLMGTVALAVVHSFLEPEDAPSGLTLEQAVAARLEGRG